MYIRSMKTTHLFYLGLLIISCTGNVTTTDGIPQLKADIQYLASDELEGRDTGTEGEAKAADYIAGRFKDMGINGGGENGSYYQTFTFTGSPALDTNNRVSLDGSIIPDSSYYPLNFSGSGNLKAMEVVDLGYGIHAPELGQEDYKDKAILGLAVVIDISSPDGIHPHSAYLAYHDLRDRAEKAEEAGAKAILFYTDDPTAEAPSKTLTENVNSLDVPVIFVSRSLKGLKSIDLDLGIDRPKLEGKNVLAYMDNGKPETIVIGAHYDHLGYGGNGSLHRGERAIHNGADDNASGVAAMLQIAHDLRNRPISYNVLFMGFSGEERGLLGSNHWVKHSTIPLENVAYMLNMDMVGRLDTANNKLSVNGVGTSPSWDFIGDFEVNGLRAVTTESGTGPSDHMSFYLSDVPVLHFFSGSHEDYHKPTDDEPLINYEGIMSIVAYMEGIITEVDDDGEIVFTKTKEEKKEAANFKVTLGIVPDYLYEEKGMRVDGVSEGRPGEKAGLMKGDIIIGMGERSVNDIYAYMEALSNFNAGQQTIVKVMREGQEVELSVTFD